MAGRDLRADREFVGHSICEKLLDSLRRRASRPH